jgi:beta-barrel assembly-enhancing protease
MHHRHERISSRRMNRRDFLWLASASSVGLGVGLGLGLGSGILAGCAVNPVTGRQELMFISEEQEIQVDRENAPHQFSADYGPVQDPALNDYLTMVGRDVARRTHRSGMPYSFRCVNATYVNAYTFPGGSMATTRGILLEMENEAELAALLGHELGHVNARHTASRMSTSMVTSLVMLGASAVLATQDETLGAVAAGLGGVAAGALLAHYSRSDEREADGLGMEYMTASGYSPEGMVGLMDVLREMNKEKPSAVEMMFSTHPMSEERYQSAVHGAATTYADLQGLPVHRERYMDATSGLRGIRGGIEKMQEGEKLLGQERFGPAEEAFKEALVLAPRDYAGLLLMAKCQLAMERPAQAEHYAEMAVEVFPDEAQGHHVAGIAKLSQDRFEAAYEQFDRYERLLPGNPNTVFLKGICQESMGHRQPAAREYHRYLQQVNSGDKAKYAHTRLVEWGYLEP